MRPSLDSDLRKLRGHCARVVRTRVESAESSFVASGWRRAVDPSHPWGCKIVETGASIGDWMMERVVVVLVKLGARLNLRSSVGSFVRSYAVLEVMSVSEGIDVLDCSTVTLVPSKCVWMLVTHAQDQTKTDEYYHQLVVQFLINPSSFLVFRVARQSANYGCELIPLEYTIEIVHVYNIRVVECSKWHSSSFATFNFITHEEDNTLTRVKRTRMPGVISVQDFVREVREDFSSPTTSNYVSRIPQCRESVNKLDEVRRMWLNSLRISRLGSPLPKLISGHRQTRARVRPT